MLFALTLELITITGGAALTYLYDAESHFAARLCAGTCLGLALLGFSVFILAFLFGFSTGVIFLAGAITASPTLLLFDRAHKERARADIKAMIATLAAVAKRPARRHAAYLIFYLLAGLVLWLVFDRAMFETSDGIYTGVTTNYGDLPFHISVITRFAYGENIPPEDPTFARVRFVYPFLADLVAAVFVRYGASLRRAVFLENIALALALVGLFHRWALIVTRDRIAALVSPALLFLSGGLGWWLLFKDAHQTETGIFRLLERLPHDYTILPDSAWRMGNILTALLVPQRSLLLGLPLAIVIFTQWWIADDEEAQSRRMTTAGLIAGLLPLIHTHTFLVVMTTGFCLMLLRRKWRAWACFFAAALVVAAPQLFWMVEGRMDTAASFLGWQPGFDSGKENIFLFWFKNTGLLIPLIVAAIFWPGKKRVVNNKLLVFYIPFTLCFIAANLFRAAPWIWDNIKILVYWYIASVPLVALMLARLWRRQKSSRYLAVAIFVSLVLAGSLDIWRIISGASRYREFDSEGVEFAGMIMNNTRPRTLILHAATFNSPVFLTGRRSLMGYPGHIWTHGLDYAKREAEIKNIYAGASDAEMLMSDYGVE